jgi:hypothetical protein
MVEFALTATVFFLLVAGILEGGRLVYSYVALGHAVHEGARTAVLQDKTEDDVRARVVDAAAPLTVPSGNVTISGFTGRELGGRVTVGASYVYTPVITMFIGGSFTMSRTAEMMVE